MASARRWLARGALAAVVLAAVGGFALEVARSRRPADAPQQIAWDRAACAHCGMLISDPSWAAQFATRDGDVLAFDDPGCLLRYEHEHAADSHAAWFHHRREDRWIPRESVGFAIAGPSPMGYDLAAVDAQEPGAISLDEARRRASEGRR